jgi:hypothetical protein
MKACSTLGLLLVAILGVPQVSPSQIPGPRGYGYNEPPRDWRDRPSHRDWTALPPILRKALYASTRLRYIATRTVHFRKDGVLSSHDEVVTRNGQFSRVDFPAGNPQFGQVIIETPKDRRHYFPAQNEIHVLPPRHEEVLGRLVRLLQGSGRGGTVVAENGEGVAGISCQELVVRDREGSIAQRILIDPKSGLILKRQLFDRSGIAQGGFSIVKVDFTAPIDPSLFTLQVPGATILTPIDLLERNVTKSGFLNVYLPSTSGFTLESSSVKKIHGEEALVENYIGQKGRRLTLFQLRVVVSSSRLREYAQRQDFKFVHWESSGKTFVLVGNLSSEELLRVAGPVSGGTASTG